MEKRNLVEDKRTPCKAKESEFCECSNCSVVRNKQNTKQAETAPVHFNDTDALARIHK